MNTISKSQILQFLTELIEEGEKVKNTKEHYDYNSRNSGVVFVSALSSGYKVDKRLYEAWETNISTLLGNNINLMMVNSDFQRIKNLKKTTFDKTEKYINLLNSLKLNIERNIISFPEVSIKEISEVKSLDLLDCIDLHPELNGEVLHTFKNVKRNYADVVFSAFRNLEDYIREKGSFSNSHYGIKLIRKAFDVEKGILTNKNDLPSEKQGLSDLFAGAIGFIKNPKSHRNLTLDYQEAVELFLFANHLFNIVDKNLKVNK